MSAVDLDALIAELRTPIRVQHEEKPNHVLRRANVSRLNAAKALEAFRRAPVSAGKVKALAEKLRAELVDHGYQDEGKMVRLCDRILSALQPGDGWQGIESLDDLREAIADEERTLQAQIAQMHAGTRDSGPREYERLAWAAFCRITANIPPDPPASLPQGEETR